ncbi:MAG: MarR family transcriptional regulator [Opitutales bacterium]|jgi:DNA-binding MarR family transcriptional regulator
MSPKNDEKRFPVLLRSAWLGLNKSFRRRLVEHGLTPAQFIALRWLMESHPSGISQSDLARLSSSNANNVADLVARMEAEGLLVRTKNETDGRLKVLSLTSKGRNIYNSARKTAVTLQQEVLSKLGDDERETFLALLDRVAEGLSDLSETPAVQSKT